MKAYLSLILVLAVLIVLPLAHCDSEAPPAKGIDIQGAHIISEGAYFRFQIFNDNSFPVNITMYGPLSSESYYSIPAWGSVDCDLVAPSAPWVYNQVTYHFEIVSSQEDGLYGMNDFTVLVLNSSWLLFFNLLPLIIGTILIIIAVILFFRLASTSKKKVTK